VKEDITENIQTNSTGHDLSSDHINEKFLASYEILWFIPVKAATGPYP
jgi:hypothetical protein